MNTSGSRPALERLAFAFYLLLFVGSCSLTGLGLFLAVLVGNPHPLLLGCSGGVLTAIIRDVGYRQWHFQKWARSLERIHSLPAGMPEAPGDDATALHHLLEEIDDALADEGRDVWKLQELRQKARAILKRDPALRVYFAQELRRHPELA